jgi:hypothetical protein
MQLELLWRDAHTLQAELERLTGLQVQLTVTDNTSTMMSVKKPPRTARAQVRVHRMFLAADARVVRALGLWVAHPKAPRSTELLNDFISENRHLIATRRTSAGNGEVRGRFFDLQALYDEENTRHFGDSVSANIRWGRLPGKKGRRRSIRFGSYSSDDNVIRMHPFLDQDWIPAYFVRYIVFHEMLHAHLGVEESPTGRRQVHTRTFRTRERQHPDYEQAIAWLATPANLTRLLRGRRA